MEEIWDRTNMLRIYPKVCAYTQNCGLSVIIGSNPPANFFYRRDVLL